MKKNYLLVASICLLLTSCEMVKESESKAEESTPIQQESSTESQKDKGAAPKIRGNRDFSFDKDDEAIPIVVQSYNFIGNTTASDAEDGDITSRITYSVKNYYNNESVAVIPLNEHGKYTLTYSVIDSDGNETTDINFIIVGNPTEFLDENGNPREFPNTQDEAELIKNSYKLVFNEEFNYTGAPGTVEGEADYNAYTYQTGGGGWGNNEVQIYEKADRTCYVSNGNLKISVVKDGSTYYSARLNTSNNFSRNWTYGIYEVTAKLPVGNGPWPAIWMMPNNYGFHGQWPQCGEIDIMETSQYYRNSIIGTVHTESYNHTKNTQKSGRVYNLDVTQYHKYSIEWLPDSIKFFVDDTQYFVYRPANYLTSSSDEITVNEWPFDYSFHFIFNIAMGGNMGGNISETLFEEYEEVAMYIDKISVYQSTYINEHYLS